MKVLVATDGTLDAERAADYIAPLAGDEPVTVLTVVDVNRNMLRDLRALYGERILTGKDQDAEYIAVQKTGSTGVSPDWPGDDRMLGQYLDQQSERRTGSLAKALEARGLGVNIVVREGEDPANGIVAELEERGCDVAVVGSKGKGMFDGLLGSTGTKMARRSPCPVLIIRP
jgi:nucleotide-binding universal stress UspA family protein